MGDAAVTPMSDHVAEFWRLLETEHVMLLVDIRRDTESLSYWDSSRFGNDVAKALVEARRPTPAADVAELVEPADLAMAKYPILATESDCNVSLARVALRQGFVAGYREAADRLAAMSNRVGELEAANRKLQHDQYEHPWTVNEAARERQRAEKAEVERDGWLKIVGDIAALVPLPSVIKATGTTGDLIDWIKQQVEGRRAAEAKLVEAGKALGETIHRVRHASDWIHDSSRWDSEDIVPGKTGWDWISEPSERARSIASTIPNKGDAGK